MTIWRTLTHVLDTASVFDAFLERAWHLNPTGPYFPKRYQEIADAVREAHFDNHLRQRAPYADPYNQLQLLNERSKNSPINLNAATTRTNYANLRIRKSGSQERCTSSTRNSNGNIKVQYAMPNNRHSTPQRKPSEVRSLSQNRTAHLSSKKRETRRTEAARRKLAATRFQVLCCFSRISRRFNDINSF